jgi:hypothetical protein
MEVLEKMLDVEIIYMKDVKKWKIKVFSMDEESSVKQSYQFGPLFEDPKEAEEYLYKNFDEMRFVNFLCFNFENIFGNIVRYETIKDYFNYFLDEDDLVYLIDENMNLYTKDKKVENIKYLLIVSK